jgi:hypothetical protein
MLVDMFGIPLATGQFVLYSDTGDEGPELALFKILELEEPDVITAVQLNGKYAGNSFYLTSPVKRMAVIGRERALFDMAECYKDSIVN